MISLNTEKFSELQGNLTETEMAKRLGIGRTQLWRAKNGKNVGQKFVTRLLALYPDIQLKDYFFFSECNADATPLLEKEATPNE